MIAELSRPERHAGVVGWPIAHSLSPVLHRAAYLALGLNHWSYHRRAIPADELAAFVALVPDSWVGLSVTMPGKEEALALSAGATDRARVTGSANTLVRRGSDWWADNTDIDGVVGALAEVGCSQARSAWIVGSGATARSSLVAAHSIGVTDVILQVRMIARPQTLDLAAHLGLRVRVRRYEQGWPDVSGIDLAISTVPAGTEMPGGPLVLGQVHHMSALDVVYPVRSRWARTLIGAGARFAAGEEMLLHQAARQIELMTQRTAPVPAMRAALARSLPPDDDSS